MKGRVRGAEIKDTLKLRAILLDTPALYGSGTGSEITGAVEGVGHGLEGSINTSNRRNKIPYRNRWRHNHTAGRKCTNLDSETQIKHKYFPLPFRAGPNWNGLYWWGKEKLCKSFLPT